ncbi:MAG: hypothetical protein KDA68_08165 [Planctomycetaceae bacterium]|nr:hypothetical protein [Planctomycetaceae bacterium]
MSRGYEAAAGTYVRWLFVIPLAVFGLMFLIVIGDRSSSLPLWFGAAAWGMAMGVHWKEYLARSEALLCPAMKRGQIGVGLGLSGVLLFGTSMIGTAIGQESIFSVLSLQLMGFLLGLSVSHFVVLWKNVLGLFPLIGMALPHVLGEKFLADWMLGESLWPSLFAVGASVCGVVSIVDRYFTMREESFDYGQPLLTLKGMREYQLQKSKRRGGDEKKRWKLWEWMEEKKYRWLMELPLGKKMERGDRRRLRCLGWYFSVGRFALIILFMYLVGWGIDQHYLGGMQLEERKQFSTLAMTFPMSLIFCLMPMQVMAMGEKFRTEEVLRPNSRRKWGRELIEDALLTSASLWSLPALGTLIVGGLWPEWVFWGGATMLTALVLAACFLFLNGLLLYLMFVGGHSLLRFNLAFGAIPALSTPIIVFGQTKMLSAVGTEFLVLISLGGMGMGVLFILGAYRRLCEMDIG